MTELLDCSSQVASVDVCLQVQITFSIAQSPSEIFGLSRVDWALQFGLLYLDTNNYLNILSYFLNLKSKHTYHGEVCTFVYYYRFLEILTIMLACLNV